jgi:hypothetical protein
MNELIFIVEDAPEGGLTARALGASIFTEADNWEELPSQVRDAVRCHFDEGHGPRVVRLHHVRAEVHARSHRDDSAASGLQVFGHGRLVG